MNNNKVVIEEFINFYKKVFVFFLRRKRYNNTWVIGKEKLEYKHYSQYEKKHCSLFKLP